MNIATSTVRRSARRLFRVALLPASALTLVVAMWLAVLLQIGLEREASHADAVARSQALARVLSEHVNYILRQSEHATQLFKLSYESSGASARLGGFARRGGLLDSVLPARLGLPMALLDRHGTPIDSVNGFGGASQAGQAYFQALTASAADAPQFSTPRRATDASRWQIQVARRLNGAAGQFDGAVVLMIDPMLFVDDYDRLDLDEQGALILISKADKLALGRAGDTLFASATLAFEARRGAGAAPDELLPRTPFDQVARIYSRSDMPRYGLEAVVGVETGVAMARFDRHRRLYLGIALAASILILAIVATLMKQSARLRASMYAARRAQATLRAAADASLDAVLILKAWPGGQRPVEDFIFEDINEKGAAMLGRERAQLLGQKAFALLPRFRASGFFRHYVQVYTEGRPLEEEVEIRIDGDAPRWIQHQIVPLQDGVAVTSRDISARKLADIEIRTNRNFLQSLIEHLPLLIYVKSLRANSFGAMMVWNRAAEQVTGYSAEQVIGHTDCQVFPPGYALCNQDQDQAMLAAPKVLDLPDQPLLRPDGSLRYLHTMTVPLLDERGRTEFVLCIAEDVTLRREQEQSLRAGAAHLRESEARLRTIADTLPTMVAYIDAGQVYRFQNRAYEREFGHVGAVVLGRTIRETIGAARFTKLEPFILRALGGETLVFEEHDDSGGVERTLEVTYIPQTGDDGVTVTGFHVMRQDISSQRHEKTRLIKLAQLDPLTGLANRAGFLQQLGASMQHSRDEQRLMALMYMDIDHFKPVNDTYGHHFGDALLKAFSARLVQTLRASDTIARLGGDECTISMDKLARAEDASGLAAKIVKAMQQPFQLDEVSVSVSVSIGLAYFRGGETDPEALIKEADRLLYQAKQAGRNTFRAAA